MVKNTKRGQNNMNVIKEKRIAKGISVEEMAILFDLTCSEYEKYENNLSIMKWDLYIIIQRYLDI